MKNHAHARSLPLIAGILGIVALASGCASGRALRAPAMPSLALEEARGAAAPTPLQENHFTRDRSGNITESHLRAVLASPVYLEEDARVGIVPVIDSYGVDEELPLEVVPGILSDALADSGHFATVSEVSTDWPATSGISGLRELAARYRSEYLVLYRHRFVDDENVNPWALMYATVIGGFVVPAHTIRSAGVLEATMFDVKTGTLLFTVYERISGSSDENVFQHGRKLAQLKQSLLAKAADRLEKQVLEKVERLVAARPEAGAVAGTPLPNQVGPTKAGPIRLF